MVDADDEADAFASFLGLFIVCFYSQQACLCALCFCALEHGLWLGLARLCWSFSFGLLFGGLVMHAQRVSDRCIVDGSRFVVFFLSQMMCCTSFDNGCFWQRKV